MSLAHPKPYICNDCGIIDLENYDDVNLCAYCGGKLVEIKIDDFVHRRLTIKDIESENIYEIASDTYSKNNLYSQIVRSRTIIEHQMFPFIGCINIQHYCPKCGSITLKIKFINYTWTYDIPEYMCPKQQTIEIEYKCFSCGYKSHEIEIFDFNHTCLFFTFIRGIIYNRPERFTKKINVEKIFKFACLNCEYNDTLLPKELIMCDVNINDIKKNVQILNHTFENCNMQVTNFSLNKNDDNILKLMLEIQSISKKSIKNSNYPEIKIAIYDNDEIVYLENSTVSLYHFKGFDIKEMLIYYDLSLLKKPIIKVFLA